MVTTAKAADIVPRKTPLALGVSLVVRVVVPLAFAWAAMHVAEMADQKLVEWDAYPAFAILCVIAFFAYGMLMG